jgi:hypothetical protein
MNKRIKLDPKVFERAAELVSTGERGCCFSIVRALYPEPALYALSYNQPDAVLHKAFLGRYFKPLGESMSLFWWGLPGTNANTHARVIALLLAARLAREEKL